MCIEIINCVMSKKLSEARNDGKENCDRVSMQSDNKAVEVGIWPVLS
jgi:hypothetical protein